MKTTSYAALQSQIGNWQYYLCRMPFSDAIENLRFAEEVKPNAPLDELLQRELTKRSEAIAKYLENNDERFFGALIVAVYGGAPKFSPIHIEGAEFLSGLIGSLGLLVFDGKEQYYVLDGQHRLAAMRKVVSEKPDRYLKDEIAIILVSHPVSSEGIERARRLFTNVNRYAVKTNKATNIVLDEDDPIAILTRRLVREDEYFQNVVKVTSKGRDGISKLVVGEALSASADTSFLTTLPTLYECNKSLLSGHAIITESKAQSRPSNEELESAWKALTSRWNVLLIGVKSFCYLGEKRSFNRKRQPGGDFIIRPIGLKAACLASGLAFANKIPDHDILGGLNKIQLLSEYPWKGLLWNAENGNMFNGKDRTEMASDILSQWMGMKKGSDDLKLNQRLNDLTGGLSKLPSD
jgi:DNA sulfur modification protein DndB